MKIFGEFIEKFVDIDYTDEMFKNYMEKISIRNITPMMVKGVLLNEKEKRKEILQGCSRSTYELKSKEIEDIDVVLRMLQIYMKSKQNKKDNTTIGRYSSNEPQIQSFPRGKIEKIRKAFTSVDNSGLDLNYGEMEKRVLASAPDENFINDSLNNMRQNLLRNHISPDDIRYTTPDGHLSKLDNVKEHIHSRKCDCGAKHTSFPNAHSHWCSAKVW